MGTPIYFAKQEMAPRTTNINGVRPTNSTIMRRSERAMMRKVISRLKAAMVTTVATPLARVKMNSPEGKLGSPSSLESAAGVEGTKIIPLPRRGKEKKEDEKFRSKQGNI